jgi:hypothetical protein
MSTLPAVGEACTSCNLMLPAAGSVRSDADAVALSVTYTPDPGRTIEEIRLLRATLPPGVLLIVGGRAIQAIAAEAASAGIPVGETLDDLRHGLAMVAGRSITK